MLIGNQKTSNIVVSKRMCAPLMCALFAVALASCGGGGGSGSCSFISGGGTTAALTPSASCAGCTFSESASSIDGSPSTFGTLTVPSVTAGDGVARATTQAGVIYGAGSEAGVLAKVSSVGSAGAGTSLLVRTYLKNALQEENVITSNGVTATGVNSPKDSRLYTFKSSKMFDAVEFGINGTTQNFSALIYEFCGG